MCREYTHGYNALAAVDESVLDHYTQALYDEPGFQDTHTQAFTDSIFHFLFPRPRLILDRTDAARPAVLVLDPLTLRIQDSPDPTEHTTIHSGALRVLVRRPIEADPDSGSTVVRFGGTTADDVEIEVLEPAADGGRARDLIDGHLEEIRFLVALALAWQVGDQTVPLDAIEEPLLSDAADPVVLYGGSSDCDTLNLAMYSTEDELTTRGDVDAVEYVLDADRTFTLQISSCVAVDLFQQAVDRQYMRFTLEVPEVLYRGETYTNNDYRIDISPVPAGGIRIVGRDSSTFAYLHGSVTNRGNGDVAVFDRADDGTFAVRLNASVGDTLEFRGEYIDRRLDTYSRAHVPPPSDFTLEEGQILVSGEFTFVRQRGHMRAVDFLLSYDLALGVSVDAATGELLTEVGEVDIDLLDAPGVFWFTAVLIGLFGGGIAAICLGPLKRILIREVTESDVAGGGLPGLEAVEAVTEGSDVRCFLESVTVLPGGIVVSGEMEAGRIESAGQVLGRSWIRLTEDEDIRFEVDLAHGSASCTSGSAVTQTSFAFEQLGIGEIEEAIASVHGDTVSLSSTAAEDGIVFVLGLAGGRVAKVRVDLVDDDQVRIRWVTYQARRRPSASIEGLWRDEVSDMVPSLARVSGATRYWGDFSARVTGLHESEYLPNAPEYSWTIEPSFGRLTCDGAECSLEIVTAEDLPDDYPHHLTLGCVATDVFGREASASVEVSAQRLSWSVPRPRSARDVGMIRIRPEEPMVAEEKKVVRYDEVMAKLEDVLDAIDAMTEAVTDAQETEEEEELERSIGVGAGHRM